jgi:hypothetical protein
MKGVLPRLQRKESLTWGFKRYWKRLPHWHPEGPGRRIHRL